MEMTMETDQRTTGLPLEAKRFSGSDAGRRLLVRAGWASALLVGAIALGLLISGCGSRQNSGTSAESSAHATMVPVSQEGTTAALEPASGQASEPAEVSEPGTAPPDLELSVDDTLFARGEIIEIRAQTTLDVVELVLSDGIHAPRPFSYDSEMGNWVVQYRIPLSPSSERLALSATARNSTKQWCRKWVFLSIAQPETQPDSTSVENH